MLIVRTIGASVGSYYLDGRDAGGWTSAAGRLLGLSGPVSDPDLAAVLQGRDPRSGEVLSRLGGRLGARRRRSGWDLIFSAPKSVSLLGRREAPTEGSVRDAHVAAVDRVLGHIEGRLTVNDASGPGGAQPAGGLVGARFEHHSSAAGEPHLHTHLLVANLTLGPKGWSAVRNDDWFVGRRSLDALYQLSLRLELAARGWHLEWRLHPDGRGDVAAVPSAAIRAASTQRRLVAAVGPFQARLRAAAQPWQGRVVEAGWDPARHRGPGPGPGPGGQSPGGNGVAGSGSVLESGSLLDSGSLLAGGRLAVQVTNHLAARRSDFREADVIVALAASHPGGATPEQATAWAERFCSASTAVPSPTVRPRWTTGLARAADDRLFGVLEELRNRPDRLGVPSSWEGTVTVLASPPGRTSLMAQSEMLEGLQREWARAGVTACIAGPTELASSRWRVLSGLAPYRAGTRAGVIVVDQADRRSSAELLQLAGAARRQGAHLVLVEGGTLPRLTNFASHGLARFAASAGRQHCPAPGLWEPGPPSAVERHVALSGREAAGALLARWGAGSRAELLVGLGLEEVRSLNAAARAMTTEAAGQPAESTGLVRGFGAGDRVVVLRAGEGRPTGGTFGDVVEASPPHGRVAIRWDGSDRTEVYGRPALAGFGHGWAVTSGLAGRAGRPLMLLGPQEAAPRLRSLVRASIEVPGPDEGRRLSLSR